MKERVFIRSIIIGFMFIVATIKVFAADFNTITRWLTEYDKSSGATRVELANKILHAFSEEKFFEETIEFNTTHSSDTINQQVWYWVGEYLYSQQSYELALKYTLQALPLFNLDEDRANCLSLISLIYFRRSNYEQAVNYAKQCYKLDEKTGDPDIMSSSLNTIAGIYIGANQPREAEKYILKAIDLAKQANNPARMSVLKGKASEVYHALGQDSLALVYIEDAYQIEKHRGNEHKTNMRLSQKASVLIGLHKNEEAEAILKNIIPYFEKCGDKQSLALACNKMGMVYLSQEKHKIAIIYYRIAANLFEEMGDKGNEMHSRRGLYEGLWSINSDSAKIELDRFNELKDSLYNMASAESLARFNAEFGSDWLQNENELQRTKTQRIIIIGSISFLILISVVWLFMRRRMRLREVALQAIITELQSQKDTNDSSITSEPRNEGINIADQKLLSELVLTVKENMQDGNLSIESLASKMCITRGQLNRRIKAITGVTTQQYVLRIRLEHARLLLVDNKETPISEVALECGFEDATSFSRAFRRTFEKSPSQYRNER